ncbi:MAG: AAA family ATPase [Cyanobacteria bacterium P01_H01_bin.15]
MKIVLIGNAGAGKSTLSRQLLDSGPAARLSLDELAFSGSSERRPLADSISDAMKFVEENESWIVEGCYSDIIEPLLEQTETLIFLNPGVEVCIRHCNARPWEPEKFTSSAEQDGNLENLIKWVKDYETRTDEYGLKRHRALFEGFNGAKVECNNPSEYDLASHLFSTALKGGG